LHNREYRSQKKKEYRSHKQARGLVLIIQIFVQIDKFNKSIQTYISYFEVDIYFIEFNKILY
jgi:hypothetical protein